MRPCLAPAHDVPHDACSVAPARVTWDSLAHRRAVADWIEVAQLELALLGAGEPELRLLAEIERRLSSC